MAHPSINDSSAMLLYEAPTGMAIFSFNGDCLNDPVEDFWANLAPPSLEFFLKYERVSTPIDLANEAIDDHLTKKLTRLCGSEKKLVVGNAEYKRIIEVKLGITCLYVGVPDCEVIKCSLKNPMRTLLPEEKSETSKLPFGKELITFLRQHDFDVEPEMVSESIAELAHLLHDVGLCEMEHLKFFRILLRDFIVKSGIDTKNWRLFHFVTVTKMICCPGSPFQVYPPVTIFSRDEYRKILANASPYKRSFSKIDAQSVYEDVVSLYEEQSVLLDDLDSLVEHAKGQVQDKLAENVEGIKQAGDSGLQSMDTDGKELTGTSAKETNAILYADGVEEHKQAGDTGLQSMDDDGKKLTPGLVGNRQNEDIRATSARFLKQARG